MARRGRLVAAFAAIVFAVAACGSGAPDDSVVTKADEQETLTIGTRFSQPGLSQRTVDGRFTGFDIDVARFVADELGVDAEHIKWVDVVAAERETALAGRRVDLVVGTYSITGERKRSVSFAGPYFETGQSLLVRLSEQDIDGPRSLNDKKLCSVRGSTPARQVKERFARSVELVEYPRYPECVTALLAGQVDAVTTDRAILAGYVARHPELLKTVGRPFSQERYGIGVRKGDGATQRAVNEAIRKMIDSGRWHDSVRRHLGPSGDEVGSPPRVTEQG